MPAPLLGAPVRDQFLLDFNTAFLNHGSFGATPRRVLNAQDELRRKMEANPVSFLDGEVFPALRAAADTLGRFLGAAGRDLVFVDNATTGMNAVIGSLQFGATDEILTTSYVYPAVRNTLTHRRMQGRVVEVEVPFPLGSAAEILERVEAALSPNTRLAVFDWISSAQGVVLPIEQLVGLCRDRGIPVLVDGAHCPGHLPVDLASLGCTWFVGNCHKWLFAPKGCAVLYASEEAQDLHPTVISHGFGQGFVAEFDWTGTKDPSPYLCSVEGLSFLEWIGWDRLRAHNGALAQQAADLISDRWGTERPVPRELTAFLVAIAPPKPWQLGDPSRLKQHLLHQGIEVPVFPFAGRNWVRISAQVYNTLDDYQRLAEAL